MWQLRFTREQGKSEGYARCATESQRQAFKKAWADAQWDQLVETRTKEQEDKRMKMMGEKGKYLTREAMVQKLGSGPRAEESAANYIRHCVAHGGEWVRRNEWAAVDEYLFVVGVKDSLVSQSQAITSTKACLLSTLI